MMRKISSLLIRSRFFILAFGAIISIADADPLETDRPDATESSSVVGMNVVQLETGISTIEENSDTSWEVFGTLVRYGLSDNLEARFVWDGYIDEGSGGLSGIGDSEIGFKYYIQPEEGFSPETALIFHTSVPIGKDGLTSDAFDPSFLFSFSHTLSETLSLGYNLGASLESGIDAFGDRTTLASVDYSLAYGIGLTERVGAYIEIFGSLGLGAPESPGHVDGGFTYLLNGDTQFDLFFGSGINGDAPDWFAGIGFSKRWK
ncbi:MAG: transporter [Verrucomicrobiae bacterium]|nr:transporter [Verrucomicrobiae bacterium]